MRCAITEALTGGTGMSPSLHSTDAVAFSKSEASRQEREPPQLIRLQGGITCTLHLVDAPPWNKLGSQCQLKRYQLGSGE